MSEFKSKFQFKFDSKSVQEALQHLAEQCKNISSTDDSAISDAIHASAMKFDVDESVLNEAWGNLEPNTFIV